MGQSLISPRCHRKVAFFFLVILIINLWFWTVKLTSDISLDDNLNCYSVKTSALPTISAEKVSKGNNIFFLETSCQSSKNGKIVINAREACAVESAAKLHQNHTVYLLYLSPEVFKLEDTESDLYLTALQSYRNVKILHIDFEDYINGTLLEKLYKSQKLQRSKYPTSHASDLLRYLTLWKYGGIYLDLDVIIIKPLDTLPKNFAGAQSSKEIASGVLSFEQNSPGHNIATQCLLDLQRNFDGSIWGQNGPGVITRVAEAICATKNISEMYDFPCAANFKVLPPEVFYPVPWQNWTKLFEETTEDNVEALVKESYVVHMWNNLSKNRKILLDEKVTYNLLAKKYCPKVYNLSKHFF